MLTFVVLFCVGAVIFCVTRSLVKPIEEVARLTDAISGDDLPEELPEATSQDEVGRLVRSFNGMVESLRSGLIRKTKTTGRISREKTRS